MKPAVILFSHGSLLCGAGQQLELHANRLRGSGEYSSVEIGYLNYSSPPFAEAVEKCAAAGAKQVLIAPYFLVPGYFVQVGLPKVLTPAREKFPEIEFKIAPPLGDHPLLAEAVVSCGRGASSAENWRVLLHSAPQFCERSRECPLFEKCSSLTPQPPHLRSGRRGVFKPQGEGEALLVMVHGSPKPESNAEMFQVVERVRAKQQYSEVVVGFMECNEPTIPEAINQLVSSGAKSVVAVPYFLHAGTHVADDLPTLLEEAIDRHPDVNFFMGDYLGSDPQVTEVLTVRLTQVQ